MKRIALLAAVSFALAAVPVALADNGSNHGNGARIQKLNDRVDRFFDRCGSTSVGAPQRCADVANRALARLEAIDAKVQQHLGERPRLHALDELLQKDIGRFQAWLGS
jgi:hypothetical protein